MLSAYKFSWTLVSWELPLDTRDAKRASRALQRKLRSAATPHNRWGNSRKGAALMVGDVDRAKELLGPVPPDGEMRFLGVTDKQFEMMDAVWGERRRVSA